MQSRKKEPPLIHSPRVPGTIGSASDAVMKKAREKIEFRKQLRAMLEARRPKDMPRPGAAAAAARQISPERATAGAVAAIIEAVSSIASGIADPGQSGEPDDPG